MKNLFYIFICIVLLSPFAVAQDEKAEEIGLDLNAVLELFSKSKDLNEFEQKLNSEDNKVNNLDLNKDENTDYIRIEESAKDNIHIIQLIAVLGEKDLQSVASIQLEQDSKGNITVQVVGDSTVYGSNYIVEPVSEGTNESNSQKDVTVSTNTDASAIHDQGASSNSSSSTTVVYVNSWPPVQTVYAPAYVVYASPYHWGYYPVYWRPWPPYPPHVYHSHVVVYRKPYYHMAPYHRYPHANSMYYNNARVSNSYKQNNYNRNTTINVNNPGNNAKKPSTNNVQKPSTNNVQKPSTNNVQKPSTNNVQKPSTNNVQKPSTNNVQKPSTTPSTKPSTGGARPKVGGGRGRR